MSSAILYLAIVAIWACVLIPRWLRRDSARGASAPRQAPPASRLPADGGERRRRRGRRRQEAAAADEAPRRRRPLRGPQSR